MRNLTEANLTDAVVARLEKTADPRFKEVMTSLIRHLHAFVREVELTEEEWFEAIKFLTATGQKCDDKRQEYILLSDVLGVSMLVDAINHRRSDGATENTVLGPFYVHGAPEIQNGDDMATGLEGRADLRVRAGCSPPTASRSRARCSTCGNRTPKAGTTCSSPTPAAGSCAPGCAPTARGASGSARSSRPPTRCRPTGRWGGSSIAWDAIRCGRRTCTSS